ncbi:unnamed protein product [Mytilus coruscus]|uniref:Uncharacterized protein n=1 Tax=Mytilus coruscus TaxID=42192 RepID=A0A6J8EN84_MYTCO|nr:unnamed protein product [Mytilus coruscus]
MGVNISSRFCLASDDSSERARFGRCPPHELFSSPLLSVICIPLVTDMFIDKVAEILIPLKLIRWDEIDTRRCSETGIFVSGSLSSCANQWKDIGCPDQVLNWIENGVDIFDMLRHFKGNFKGCDYDDDSPPSRYVPNPASCAGFSNFISTTLSDRIANGSITVLGRMDLQRVLRKTKLCAVCGYVNDVGFKFCQDCGWQPVNDEVLMEVSDEERLKFVNLYCLCQK